VGDDHATHGDDGRLSVNFIRYRTHTHPHSVTMYKYSVRLHRRHRRSGVQRSEMHDATTDTKIFWRCINRLPSKPIKQTHVQLRTYTTLVWRKTNRHFSNKHFPGHLREHDTRCDLFHCPTTTTKQQ